MLYYLTGMATERSAVLAYNFLHDGVMEMGETGIAKTVIGPIRRQEPGHYAFYQLSARALWGELAAWQKWMVRLMRRVSFAPVGANNDKQKADFGDVMTTLGITDRFDDFAEQISRVERELLWARSRGLKVPDYVAAAFREARRAGRGPRSTRRRRRVGGGSPDTRRPCHFCTQIPGAELDARRRILGRPRSRFPGYPVTLPPRYRSTRSAIQAMSAAVCGGGVRGLHDVAEHDPDDHVDGGVELGLGQRDVVRRDAGGHHGLGRREQRLGVGGQQRQQLGVGAVGRGDDRVQQPVVLRVDRAPARDAARWRRPGPSGARRTRP